MLILKIIVTLGLVTKGLSRRKINNDPVSKEMLANKSSEEFPPVLCFDNE